MGFSKAAIMALYFYFCLALIWHLGTLILQESFLKHHQCCLLSPAMWPEIINWLNWAMLDMAEAFFLRGIRYNWPEMGINPFAPSCLPWMNSKPGENHWSLAWGGAGRELERVKQWGGTGPLGLDKGPLRAFSLLNWAALFNNTLCQWRGDHWGAREGIIAVVMLKELYEDFY